jgi:hypothetical protein
VRSDWTVAIVQRLFVSSLQTFPITIRYSVCNCCTLMCTCRSLMCKHKYCATYGSDWSWARPRAGRQFKFTQLAMALCIPAVGESYDYVKAAISLERSISFPWIKDCVQIHQTLFPPWGWGLGTRLTDRRTSAEQSNVGLAHAHPQPECSTWGWTLPSWTG